MNHNFIFDEEDQFAASLVAGLAGKRDRENEEDDSPDNAAGGWKKSRAFEGLDHEDDDFAPIPLAQMMMQDQQRSAQQQQQQQQLQEQQHQEVQFVPAPVVEYLAPEEPVDEDLAPYPFYYYKDYSTMADPDPLTPLTPPGRVPGFPAKMHAILTRTDLKEIIQWQPHGRSWKVLKPREFEVSHESSLQVKV